MWGPGHLMYAFISQFFHRDFFDLEDFSLFRTWASKLYVDLSSLIFFVETAYSKLAYCTFAMSQWKVLRWFSFEVFVLFVLRLSSTYVLSSTFKISVFCFKNVISNLPVCVGGVCIHWMRMMSLKLSCGAFLIPSVSNDARMSRFRGFPSLDVKVQTV